MSDQMKKNQKLNSKPLKRAMVKTKIKITSFLISLALFESLCPGSQMENHFLKAAIRFVILLQLQILSV